MAGDNVDNVEGRTAREQQERAAGQQRDHDRRIESDTVARNGKGIDRGAFKTDFMQYSVNGLRKMIMNSNPGKISVAGDHWKSVHQLLSGGEGDGKTGAVDTAPSKTSIAGTLQTAVDNVLEHWEGAAAEAFKRRADEVGAQIRNGAAYANFTAEQLFAISKDLDAAIAEMEPIEEPSRLESAGDKLNDSGRDDAQMKRDLATGASADAVAEANEKNLSLGMERKLQAVAVMERLATNYQVYTKNLRANGSRDQEKGIAPPNSDVTMPAPIALPSAAAGGPGTARAANKPWSAGSTSSIKPGPTVPRDAGITGGSQLPAARTKVDSISPGLTGTGPSTSAAGGISGGGGGLGASGTQSPGVVAPGGGAGLGRGAAARGGIGPGGVRGGLAGGGTAAGRGAGGRAGMGAMGGAGAGAAGRAGAGAGSRGALAKSRGGVVGAAKGVSGKGAGGGAGLHGSRGGTQRGAMAGGMAGGMGSRNGRRPEDENNRGDRPDYLVEDEETWISEEDRNRNVPRTIE
ncbi:hypothetical protein IM697_34700 [Streptomyces ferrugineus]|uniref:PPE family domain-containing protein n=1 Tax=Streptomyces ferrugineus TaxID=1413221 RepID=A0A7M2SIA8_9ACTN|nr:hypothetical protein [Streptomyces ferrugineus]QOV35183.1 hypothetical protein IM697_34700 [Streptomyces ferrugineus]